MRNLTLPASTLTRIAAAVERFGEMLFRRSDARARASGWDVTVTGRLSRSYRDPRFDRLASCSWCTGRGTSPAGGDCARCHGTGRIVHDPSRRRVG